MEHNQLLNLQFNLVIKFLLITTYHVYNLKLTQVDYFYDIAISTLHTEFLFGINEHRFPRGSLLGGREYKSNVCHSVSATHYKPTSAERTAEQMCESALNEIIV